MDNNGSVGIGNLGINTDLSGAKLNILTGAAGYGFLQSNGTVAVGSYVNSTGGWLGTKSNHPLHFFSNDSLPLMTLHTNGNVTIGTTAQGAGKLHVLNSQNFGISSETSNASSVAVYGTNTSNINSGLSAGVAGTSTFGSGVSGSSSSGNGIYGSTTTGYAGYFDGRVAITTMQSGGTSLQICWGASPGILATCASSLRYKKDLQQFAGGLNIIERLRPITYKWKSNDVLDVGFAAEDVAKINPLFVTYDQKGEIEGVKYDRLSVVFVNAFKQQLQQIEQLQRRNEQQQNVLEQQQRQLDALTKVVCRKQSRVAICREGER